MMRSWWLIMPASGVAPVLDVLIVCRACDFIARPDPELAQGQTWSQAGKRSASANAACFAAVFLEQLCECKRRSQNQTAKPAPAPDPEGSDGKKSCRILVLLSLLLGVGHG